MATIITDYQEGLKKINDLLKELNAEKKRLIDSKAAISEITKISPNSCSSVFLASNIL